MIFCDKITIAGLIIEKRVMLVIIYERKNPHNKIIIFIIMLFCAALVLSVGPLLTATADEGDGAVKAGDKFDDAVLMYQVTSEGEVCVMGLCGMADTITIPKTAKNGDVQYTVTGIADYCFYGEEFEKAVLPDTIQTMGWYAFQSCTNLKSVNIPASLAEIPGGAFDSCTALQQVTFSENGILSYILTSAFSNCASLTELSLPQSVTYLEEFCFYNSGLVNICLPDRIEVSSGKEPEDGGIIDNATIDLINLLGKDSEAFDGEFWTFDGENTITVRGDVTIVGSIGMEDEARSLIFNIENNSTVMWKAYYFGYFEEPTPDDIILVDVKGNGTFRIDGDGASSSSFGYIGLNGAGNTQKALRAESGIAVIVSGSIVNVYSHGRCTAIEAAGSVFVSDDSTVSAFGLYSTAIFAGGNVIVADSRIDTPPENFYGVAIRSDAEIQITIEGDSYINARSGIIARKASVTVGGTSIVQTEELLTFVDGELLGNAIMANNVTVEDFAQVSARNGAAIIFDGELIVSGGAVLAYGDGIGGAEFEITGEFEVDAEPVVYHMLNVVLKIQDMEFRIAQETKYSDNSDIASYVCGNGVIIAWDFIQYYDTVVVNKNPWYYNTGDTTDIFLYSKIDIEDVEYGWASDYWGICGIFYGSGQNKGSFPITFTINDITKPFKYNPKKAPSVQPKPPDDDTNPGDNGNHENENDTDRENENDSDRENDNDTDRRNDNNSSHRGNNSSSNSRYDVSIAPISLSSQDDDSNSDSNGSLSGSFSGNGSYSKGSGTGITYTVQKDFALFNSVKVGSRALTRNKDYKAENGSTKITLLPPYLDKLNVGSHTLTVFFQDDTAAIVPFTVVAGQKLLFTDVAVSAWCYNAVNYVFINGLMIGTTVDKFSPNSILTRGMIVAILYRNAGTTDVSRLPNPFDDISGGQWYTDAVKWAYANKIVTGYGNALFGPNDPVTKEQLALILFRLQQSSDKKPANGNGGMAFVDADDDQVFTDADKISDWAKDAVNVLNKQGTFYDIPGKLFSPQSPATRAQTASMMYRNLTAAII